MTSKSGDLEVELRQNLKLRRELKGEIAKAESGRQLMHARWLPLRDWFVTRWGDFEGWREDRRRQVGSFAMLLRRCGAGLKKQILGKA
jgi:hypothetical protein